MYIHFKKWRQFFVKIASKTPYIDFLNLYFWYLFKNPTDDASLNIPMTAQLVSKSHPENNQNGFPLLC